MKPVSFALLVLLTSVASTADESNVLQRTISVSGTASTYVVPDSINWSISTLDESVSLADATASSSEKLKSILQLVRELGVDPGDVQTGYLSINREYNQDEHGRRVEFRCFSVRRSVSIEQKDTSKFDEFLTRMAGTTDFEATFSLTSSRMTELRWQTRLKAVKLAREKAAAMADAAGATIGPVVSLMEGDYNRDHSAWRDAMSASNRVFMEPSGSSRPSEHIDGTLQPGSIEIKVDVDAIFELQQGG